MKHKHIHSDLIIAWANGETIQERNFGDKEWQFFDGVWSDSDDFEYRIKPIEKVVRWQWIYRTIVDDEGNGCWMLSSIYLTDEEAKEWFEDESEFKEYFKKEDSKMEFTE